MTAELNSSAGPQWPRVLLLSDEGPQLSTAGGILLYRLLEDCPTDRLRVIEREQVPGWTRLACPYDTITPRWRRLERSRFHRWHRTLRSFGLVPPVPASAVEARLGGFAPEVVLCVMQMSSYYDIAWRYAREKGLPLVALVHDVNEEWERVFRFAVPAQRRRDGAFYRYAARRLCISPEMERLCAQLYGERGDVQYPNRSEALRPRPLDEAGNLKQAGRLTVGFVGNLNYGYGNELLRLLPAFRATQTRLVVFSKPPGGAAAALIEAEDCVDFRGFLSTPEEAWAATKRDCDAVILPYPHPAGTMERLLRHHFPSKLPEYLALGMPVIVTGPEYATGVRWAMQNPAAVATCTAPEPAALRGVLERLRSDAFWRLALADNGVLAGSRDFDPTAIKRHFLEHLRNAAMAHE